MQKAAPRVLEHVRRLTTQFYLGETAMAKKQFTTARRTSPAKRKPREVVKNIKEALSSALSTSRTLTTANLHALWRDDGWTEEYASFDAVIAGRVKCTVSRRHCVYEGRKAELIAAGIAAPDWFASGRAEVSPGGAERKKRSFRFAIDGHAIRTTTRKGTDIAVVSVWHEDAIENAFKERTNSPAPLDVYDGRRAVTWEACGWVPRRRQSV